MTDLVFKQASLSLQAVFSVAIGKTYLLPWTTIRRPEGHKWHMGQTLSTPNLNISKTFAFSNMIKLCQTKIFFRIVILLFS